MNDTQKLIVGLGLFALAATTIVAPYSYGGHNLIAAAMDGGGPRDRYRFEGIAYAPLWNPPEAMDISRRLTAAADADDVVPLSSDIETTRLATDRLMLWWLGIAIVTAAGIALASRSTEPAPHASDATAPARSRS